MKLATSTRRPPLFISATTVHGGHRLCELFQYVLWSYGPTSKMRARGDASLEAGVRWTGHLRAYLRSEEAKRGVSDGDARLRLISSPEVVAAFDLGRFRAGGFGWGDRTSGAGGIVSATRCCGPSSSICRGDSAGREMAAAAPAVDG